MRKIHNFSFIPEIRNCIKNCYIFQPTSLSRFLQSSTIVWMGNYIHWFWSQIPPTPLKCHNPRMKHHFSAVQAQKYKKYVRSGKNFLWSSFRVVAEHCKSNTLKVMMKRRNFTHVANTSGGWWLFDVKNLFIPS